MRDVDDAVHRELRARAARVGLSLSEYLRQELERIAARPPIGEVLARAASRPGGATTEQVVAAIRAVRDGQ
ncbi:MAG: FitA-like ribbon-helix-helix domain-containing protein [Pseudonocardiaceae bacterium]